MPTLKITPQTNATLAITVKTKSGALVTDAVVTADVFAPWGKLIASAVAMPHAGSGVYNLPILPEWSTGVNGEAIEGMFVAVVKSVRGVVQRVRKFDYLVTFDA